ncbi:MAG: amidohydrolase family protein, partial [Candidatus Neomarinimicrobiota bacterium]
MKILYLFLILLSLHTYSDTIIYSSNYIDVISGEIKKNTSITIKDSSILSIDKGFITPDKDDNLIDLRGLTLMPGLMDMHVHFGQEYQSKAERP